MVVTGSMVKADFLKTDRLAEEEFEIPGNPHLWRLLEELQTTVTSWYHKWKKTEKYALSLCYQRKYGIRHHGFEIKHEGVR